MFDFIILMPTYNRAEELYTMAKQLRAEANKEGVTVLHCVLDDGSDLGRHIYEPMLYSLQTKKYRVKYKRNPYNFGKHSFWKTWDSLIKLAKYQKWKYCICIPDDHILCNKFLRRTKSDFNRLRLYDKKSVAMNILVNSLSNWNMNRFIDGAFICNRTLFECIDWTIAPIPVEWFAQSHSRSFKINPPSSGVWKQVSQRLSRNQEWRIGKVMDVSYLKPMDCKSVMFPKDKFPRRPTTWGRNNFIDNKEKE